MEAGLNIMHLKATYFQNLMNCIESWFNENELILNIRKSCALSFHPRKRKRVCKPSIVYNEINIPYK
jgi:hypothetical protein